MNINNNNNMLPLLFHLGAHGGPGTSSPGASSCLFAGLPRGLYFKYPHFTSTEWPVEVLWELGGGTNTFTSKAKWGTLPAHPLSRNGNINIMAKRAT